MTACIIGNGPSRLEFDLNQIHNKMTTYGCNALYRDFIPDYLISMDWPIVYEIIQNKIQDKTCFYTQDAAQFNSMTIEEKLNINFLKPMAKRLDSGNSALELALEKNNHKTIYMIGFDYNLDGGTLKNVYHGSSNYARNGNIPSASQMSSEWRLRLRKIVKQHVDVQFIRVNGSNTDATIDETNYSEITIEQFKEIYDRTN